jgi:MscS family membrane protein
MPLSPWAAPLDSLLPPGLQAPSLGLLLASGVWLVCTLLARRLPPSSLLRPLLLRARLSLALPPLIGGVLFGLLRSLPLVAGFPLPGPEGGRQLVVMVALVWTLVRCQRPLIAWLDTMAAMEGLEGRQRLALLNLIQKLTSLVVALLVVWQLLRLLGVSALGLVTAGGFGAAALAFGARTLVENGLSGLGLYLHRPFVVGDAIRLPGQQLQGEVEAIGWFYTRLRDPQRQTLVVPNGLFASQPVQNLSQVDRRRVAFDLQLRPQDLPAVAAITAELRQLLGADPAVDPDLPARVHLLDFGEAGPRLTLLCHGSASDLASALELQQRLVLQAGAVVERHGAALAAHPRAGAG